MRFTLNSKEFTKFCVNHLLYIQHAQYEFGASPRIADEIWWRLKSSPNGSRINIPIILSAKYETRQKCEIMFLSFQIMENDTLFTISSNEI